MRTFLSLLMVALLSAPAHGVGDSLATLFPEIIGNMQRIELVTGEKAQDAVNKLHGKQLSALGSAVARYAMDGQGGTPTEVWVSRVASEQEARRQTGLMVHLMYENPKSPFKSPKRLSHGERAVYRFEGMGQSHLIWFSGDLIWWVSTESGAEQAVLDALCK